MRFLHSLAFLAVLAVPAAASATTINLGTGLGNLGQKDPIYSGSQTYNSSASYYISSANPMWYQPTSGHWINLTGNGGGSFGSGDYYYFSTFSIATAGTLSGFFAGDNSVSAYVWNMNTGGSSQSRGYAADTDGTNSPTNSYNSPVSFNTVLGPGTYTLFFDVVNKSQDGSDSPTGLYVNASVTTNDISPTPEPSSLLLLGSGIVGVAGIARRKLLRA